MTFGASRFEKNKIEMHRFCNKLNMSIVGGASKLFKYALKENPNWTEVVSYADRSWSMGNLYETLGFKFLHSSNPNYSYIIDGIRENRFKFRKSKLVKEGYDSSLTEVEIMNDRGYYRIFDSGSKKYIFRK